MKKSSPEIRSSSIDGDHLEYYHEEVEDEKQKRKLSTTSSHRRSRSRRRTTTTGEAPAACPRCKPDDEYTSLWPRAIYNF